jgi:hypothetical protein
MAEADAAAFSISNADQHIRLDPAKVNIAPRAQAAKWFKLVRVKLDNGTADYPKGDEVQTVEIWSPPNAWADVSTATLNAILTEIDRGLDNGQRYSNAPKAEARAVWKVVEKHCPGKPKGECLQIIHAWLKTGLLFPEDYDDPIRRETAKGLRVNGSKRPGTKVPD